MDNEKFQELVLKQFDQVEKRFAENDKFQELVLKKFEENDKFQELVVNQFAKIVGQLENLNDGHIRLETRMDDLGSKVDKLESKVDKLQVRIENEVIEKVRALFDAQSANKDHFEQTDRRLEHIEIDTAFLVNRVTRLEKQAK